MIRRPPVSTRIAPPLPHTTLFRSDDVSNDATPTPLPYCTFTFVGQQGPNGYWTANANAAVFLRDEGTESRRLSLAGGWHLPLPTSGGHQFDLSVGVRGDIYSVDDVIVDGESRDGIVARLVPEAVASWRYPLVRARKSTPLNSSH